MDNKDKDNIEKLREMLYVALERGDKSEILEKSQELDASIVYSMQIYLGKHKEKSHEGTNP